MGSPTAPARRVELKHLNALDGLRGIAVIAVMLYHGAVGWSGGGFLGVEVFFVLSGFLITSLLLAEWREHGRIALPAFWARRARRLLPALFLLIIVIGIYYTLGGFSKAVPDLQGDGLSALLYFNNWHQIASDTNYFVANGPISPFQHTWSLSIEEQFYVVWPLLVFGVLALTGRARPGRRSFVPLLVLTLAGVIASAVVSGLLFNGGLDLDRVYYGTDTRASGLLAGAALAIWLARRRDRQRDSEQQPDNQEHPDSTGHPDSPKPADSPSPRLVTLATLTAPWLSVAALIAVLAAFHYVSYTAKWLFPYGLLGLDLAVVVIIATVSLLPGTPVDRVLSWRPLRGVGQISYGLYLWHFPLFLWLSTSSTGISGTSLLMVRLAVTVAVSLVSYFLVEQPIRRRRWPTWMVGVLAPVAVAAAVAALLIAVAAGTPPTAVNLSAIHISPSKLRGTSPGCQVTLTDAPQYGFSPIKPWKAEEFELAQLGHGTVHWQGQKTRTFNTCPPKRIMVIGDSIAFTISVPMMTTEEDYGVEMMNAATLGCAFGTKGELYINGIWQAPPLGCPHALSTWEKWKRKFQIQEVVIELGFRDTFDWMWNGRVVHLGDRKFDTYVQKRMDKFVKVLGAGGTKLLFLTVPVTDPVPEPDGKPAPQADPKRRRQINTMIRKAVATDPLRAAVLDINKTIAPHGVFELNIKGQACRYPDGIHITPFCSKLLEPTLLTAARKLLEPR